MNLEEAKLFLKKYLEGTASPEEHDQFLTWLEDASDPEINAIMEVYLKIASQNVSFPAPKGMIDDIEAALNSAEVPPRHRIAYLPYIRFGKIAAAVIAVCLTVIIYLALNKDSNKLMSHQKISKVDSKDISAPSFSKARLKLATGEEIILDELQHVKSVVGTGIQVGKTAEGQYDYTIEGPSVLYPHTYNLLSNPRGSDIVNLTLEDGTKVWLNSESVLNFPVAFQKDKRIVEVKGEVYFEVAHDATRPFIVKTAEATVRVLGTHFNINAYNDVAGERITLLEGSIEVSSHSSRKPLLIRPGQQAITSKDGIHIQSEIDVLQVTGWQRGMFEFDNAPIEIVLKQVERWYDVSVEYGGKQELGKIGGGISKKLPLSKIIELLNDNGIKCRLEGRTIKIA